jgi:rhodanese-related sulfurtransferase
MLMMKLLLLLIIIVLGWDIFWWLMGVKPLFPWQLDRKLKQDHNDLSLIDVRTPEEFHWFHLPNAKNLPIEKGLPRDLPIPKTNTVVVICMTGHRSPIGAHRLGKAGFARVYNLTWGMLGWKLWEWLKGRVTGK